MIVVLLIVVNYVFEIVPAAVALVATWNWLVAPAGFPELSFVNACGIALIISIYRVPETKSVNAKQGFAEMVGLTVMRPTAILLVSGIVYLLT